MNATTKTTIDLAKTLAKSGFHIPAIEIHTPDGRTWNIATVPAGRGRRACGSQSRGCGTRSWRGSWRGRSWSSW
ncbi:MAG: hypothetical protein ACK462_08600, partial [Planctomyces sp.]